MKLIVAAGFVLRVVLWLSSDGSNDIRIWARFADEIDVGGILHEYVASPRFNHPPLMGFWAVGAMHAARALHVPFAYVFKLLPMSADAIGVFLLLRIARSRGASEQGAWRGAAVFATSLVAILLAGYHGNTDSMCALLVLLAVALVDDGDRPFLAGLAFAAALNVKLIPLVLAPCLFIMQAKTLRHAVLWSLGFGLGMTPFLAPLIAVGDAFYKNAIAYNSTPNRWGIHFFLDEGMQLHIAWLHAALKKVDAAWAFIARYVILASSAAVGVWARRRRMRPLAAGAVVISLFLLLTPGIGVQYFVFPALLLTAVDLRRSFLYGLTAGVFIGSVYVHFSPLVFPLASTHKAPFPVYCGVLGLFAWAVLLELCVSRLRATSFSAAVADR